MGAHKLRCTPARFGPMSPYFSALDLSTDTGESTGVWKRKAAHSIQISPLTVQNELNRYVNLGRDHPEVVVVTR